MRSEPASGSTKSFTCHIETLSAMIAAVPASTAMLAQNALRSGISTASATPPVRSNVASAPYVNQGRRLNSWSSMPAIMLACTSTPGSALSIGVARRSSSAGAVAPMRTILSLRLPAGRRSLSTSTSGTYWKLGLPLR